MNILSVSFPRTISNTALLAGLSLFGAGMTANAAPIVTACDISGAAGRVEAVARSSLFTVHRDFSGGIEGGVRYPAGSFDTASVLRAGVNVGGTGSSCLLATLSTNAQPYDNAMVFQVRVDGKPMRGHWNPAEFLGDNPNIPDGFNVPVVWQANLVPGENELIDPPWLGAYTFFASVTPGPHVVEVVAAGCCGTDVDLPANSPTGMIRSATLVLQHR